jgi:hypothetical protein
LTKNPEVISIKNQKKSCKGQKFGNPYFANKYLHCSSKAGMLGRNQSVNHAQDFDFKIFFSKSAAQRKKKSTGVTTAEQ